MTITLFGGNNAFVYKECTVNQELSVVGLLVFTGRESTWGKQRTISTNLGFLIDTDPQE
jgi:hypothetical protein